MTERVPTPDSVTTISERVKRIALGTLSVALYPFLSLMWRKNKDGLHMGGRAD